jgi:hypothetical protein
VLAERYRLVDLLSESGHGRFWRAHDRILERHVALHVLAADDDRAGLLLEAARSSATVLDARFLRVLDAERNDEVCFVVNEWGSGTSLDIMLATNGPLAPREAAWIVAEVADSIATAHAKAVPHGRLVPENVLIDNAGAVRIIGFCVDAALHGLPPGELRTDVRDLAGLLHASLTGKWAGDSTSAVPRVPRDHGRVLRPRQVRAGVPRPLDDLCDELLNPKGSRIRDVRDIASARGICVFLSDFVGDAGGLGPSIAARNPDKHETVTLPFVPDILARPDDVDMPPVEVLEPGPEPEVEPEVVPEVEAEVGPEVEAEVGPEVEAEVPAEVPAELPTQAGMPIFDDETDDVSWLEKRRDPPPPPPPFEEPPERPLFAPEDAPRRRRPVLDEAAAHEGQAHRGPRGDEYWPFRGAGGSSSGSGTIPVYVDHEAGADESVPGRRWLRLAALVALVLLAVVVIAVAYNVSRGRTPLGQEQNAPAPTPSSEVSPSESTADLVPVTDVVADDFDPQADPPSENPDDAGNAVDGDPGTSWATSTYQQQFGPAGLKSGVGLVLDLRETRDVSTVRVDLVGDGTEYSLYLTDEVPTGVEDLTAADLEELPDETVGLSGATSGRYLVLWLTALPGTDDGRFRGEVVDVEVLAR